MAAILKSQIKDEGEFRAAIQSLIDAKIAHLHAGDGSGPPDDTILSQFIKRTPRGDPHPDSFEIDCEVIDDTPVEEASDAPN